MKYYYYKIENKLTGDKYIGITLYPQVRKNRHFSKLRKHAHFNSHLQNAFDYYGEINFFFEVIEERECEKEEAYLYEKKLIKEIGNFPNGYNITDGGGHPIHSNRKFSHQDILHILSTKDFLPRSGTIVAEIFNCPRGTINNILARRNYIDIAQKYQELSLEEKNILFEEFCDETNFIEKFYSHKRKDYQRNQTDEEILMVLIQRDYKFPKTAIELVKNFKMSNYSVIQQILTGKTYQDVVVKYKNMSIEEKTEIACRYAEKYSCKPIELLETP